MAADTLTALLPLEPPPPPPAPWWDGLLLPALAVLLVLAALWWWTRPRQRRARQLGRLQRRLTADPGDVRLLAAELDGLLRAALGRQRLQPDIAPAPLPAGDWQALLDGLAGLRFAAAPPPAARLAELLPAARRVILAGHD